tara:strand:+ start:86 stop:316 length:231 start_codon:yes stop_codon:yes gene_type:complete
MANQNAGTVEVSDTIVHSTKIKILQYITDQPMAETATMLEFFEKLETNNGQRRLPFVQALIRLLTNLGSNSDRSPK